MRRVSDPPRLETQRLVLRAHCLDDYEASVAMWADSEVVRHIGDGTPSSREASWSRLLRHAGHWQLLGFGYWAVEDKETGLFLGEVGFADYQREMEPSLNGRPEAGWVLSRAARGRGLATEAVLRMVDWADMFLKNPTTVCVVQPDHGASIRVAEKTGYKTARTASCNNGSVLIMERSKHGLA